MNGSHAAEIVGAGSSAAAPLYKAWAEQWAHGMGAALNYAPVGSGTGIKAIEEGKGDFGASDVSLSKEELDKYGLVNFPVAISGVVPIVNLPGVPHDELKLTGPILADIFAGKITQWNAPQIAALNRGLPLPALPITIIGRADGSGTTYVMSNYLGKVSEDWAKRFGNNFKIQWPASAKLATGTSGMIKAVSAQPGAIGYAEWGQAEAEHLNIARVANQKGNYPAPNAASFKAALEGSGWSTVGDFDEMLTDTSGLGAWPITGGTFIIMPRHVSDAKRAEMALSFFSYGFAKGDTATAKQGWIPLPERTQVRVLREMSRLVDTKGLPLNWKMAY
ncbi:MAG: pstS [Rhodocyclales bacterium]|nr:pstS [Rhodocyclales bacterium]